jgi:arginyl-tRNA synthetase
MNILDILQQGVKQAVKTLYNQEIETSEVVCAVTRKEFTGDYTVVVFPYVKAARKSPPQIGEELGKYLSEHLDIVCGYNVIQGFCNLEIQDSYWIQYLEQYAVKPDFGQGTPKTDKVMIEYSSPNTNKPLHLGHIRNILLGWSNSKIFEAAGYPVIRTKVVNDRGIAICKSMLAWQLYGKGATPHSTGIKGDHFVGHYYVEFEKHFQAAYKHWQTTPHALEILGSKRKAEQTEDEFFKEYKNTYFNEHSKLGKDAREMLLHWEAGEPETIDLWSKMNAWVYEGFNATYQKLGVWFDKIYYESESYKLGRDTIEDGLKKGIFNQKPDNSIWIDLTEEKLDHKLVLRGDGTSVYITQDIGMADTREKDWGASKVIYITADEQIYHFQVLFAILKKLEQPYANGLFHLTYGMVELPSGKMKSREGTVVDADDLIDIVIQEASDKAKERGETSAFTAEEQQEINRKVGLAALKYHILKVNPKKKMVFDPSESVDMQGQTGPYIQYSYVRINGVVNKAIKDGLNFSKPISISKLEMQEKDMILKLYEFPQLISDCATNYDPSGIAHYCYDLAKLFHKFWHDLSIFNCGDEDTMLFRLKLSNAVGQVIKKGMDLLGIEMPERM